MGTQDITSKINSPCDDRFVRIYCGFPVNNFCNHSLPRKQKLIKIDQILRARGIDEEGVRDCDMKAYHMRVRFHKMYYHFKPGKMY